MTIENLIQEMQELKVLEQNFLENKLEKKQDYWNKVTAIHQLLVKIPEMKTADYEKYKAEVEQSINVVKEFQAEKERRYIALREQMSYNLTQIEKELEPIETQYQSFQENADAQPDMEFFNTLNRLAKRIQTVRPLEKDARENLTTRIQTILSTMDEQRQAAREKRIQESEQIRAGVADRIDAEYAKLQSAEPSQLQQVYDDFFNTMEAIKPELDSESMVKKHVDALWKHWKKVKEDAKELLTGLYNSNYEMLNQELDEFTAKLDTITNPKDAFNQYKSIQKKAIAAVIKRRQKDKIFKRFKDLWTSMQTRFESHYAEIEAQRKYREEIKAKEQDKKAGERDRQAEQLKEQLAVHEEAVSRLKADMKASKSETFNRKAMDVLMVQEQLIAEIQRKLSKLNSN